MRKLLAATVVAGLALTACSSSTGSGSGSDGSAPGAQALTDAKG